jgi:hypothetical protein
MKTTRRICATLVLTLTLTLTGLAGEIHTPGVTPTPPPAPATSQQDPTASGDELQPQDADGTDFLTPATEAALSLFQTVLSLF